MNNPETDPKPEIEIQLEAGGDCPSASCSASLILCADQETMDRVLTRLQPYQRAILDAPKYSAIRRLKESPYTRPWEIVEALADKSIKPEVGETLEYLWPGYDGEGQWRRCTITKITEGQSWTKLHERTYWGIDHKDNPPHEGPLHVRAFRRLQVVESGKSLDDLADNWERAGFLDVATVLRNLRQNAQGDSQSPAKNL